MDSLKDQERTGGKVWIDLQPEERSDIILIMAEAKKENISLRQVWEAYKNGKLDAAPMVRRTLSEAIADTIRERTKELCRPRYLEELESFLDRFADGRGGQFIDRIGKPDIQTWMDNQKWAPTTYNSNLGRISSLFNVAYRNGYIKNNPADLMGKQTVTQNRPERFTAKEAKQFLKLASKQKAVLPYFVLGLFAGVRPEELETITWGNIDLDAGQLNLSGDQSKVRKPRTTELHPTCLTWLRPLVKEPNQLIAPSSAIIRKLRRNIKTTMGLEKWTQDVVRHTAASFLVQLHRNKAQVALWLGNSERELDQHYLSTVTEKECAEFWSLTPKQVAKDVK
jgi:integrase